MRFLVYASLLSVASVAGAADSDLSARIDAKVSEIESKVIGWRRDIHEHPELGNREFRTAKLVADHLKKLGLEVETEVAHTGVVGVLEGGKAGPVVALRADMDALPVTEQVEVPFASQVRTTYNGIDVGVMHACGHDNHVAILMGVAEVFASMREDLPGTIKFIFQPAEEGAPAGEEGGAEMMVAEGVLSKAPQPEAIFGLHVTQGWAAGEAAFKPLGALASADEINIVIRGEQTHAAQPWMGVDPIVAASQVVVALQTIVSRQVDLLQGPSVVSIGTINGGVRNNIIPDRVEMTGTIRTLVPETRTQIHERVKKVAEDVAQSMGATAEVDIRLGYPVTMNDAALAAKMRPTLERVLGAENVQVAPPVTGAEDFSYFANVIPGLFYFLGVRPKEIPREEAIPNHSPFFFADESALAPGVRSLAHLALDYMTMD